MKREYIEAGILIGAVALAIYLSKKGDATLNSAVSKPVVKTGENGGFQNWTDDEMVYDDHLYKNANGLKGIKIK